MDLPNQRAMENSRASIANWKDLSWSFLELC